jgi:ribonuclease HI
MWDENHASKSQKLSNTIPKANLDERKDERADINPSYEIVYIDGSSLNNGSQSARAGIGVYWGENDPRNVSDYLKYGAPTNQRAELSSAIRALENVVSNFNSTIEIRSDSHYTIKSMTKWLKNWKKNGWKNSLGQEIKNKDLIQKLDNLCQQHKVIWTYVPAHKGIHGNEMANLFAQKGAASVNSECQV